MSPVLPVVFLVYAVAFAAIAPPGGADVNQAAQIYWNNALPNMTMPLAISDMVKKATAPRADNESHHSVNCLFYYRSSRCSGAPPSAPAAVVGVFFRETDIKVGKVMTVAMPSQVPEGFLPPNVAEKIPFGNLNNILAKFNVSTTSREAAEVNYTMLNCADPPTSGEQKACVTSLEAVVETAMGFLGTRNVSVAASALTGAGLPHRAYMVRSVHQLGSSRVVACHNKPYPYALYLCHTTRRSQAYKIVIQGNFRGDQTIAMVAVCHRDTRNWTPSHPAFKVLGEHPGGNPVCHFTPYADLLFVAKVAHG
ncbi:unnamed protein product [Alopecurus aequalis]